MRKAVNTLKAPKAIGPYSQAIITGNFIFTSGQIPIDPATGELVDGDIKLQIKKVVENIKAILESSGSGLDKVIKTTVFLKNLKNFDAVNEIYKEYFTEPFPARSAVEVSNLPKNVEVEIEAVATL